MEPKVTFFLGANTPSGFYSLYDQMLEPEKARRVIDLGAFCVVVGSCITRPQLITKSFAERLEL